MAAFSNVFNAFNRGIASGADSPPSTEPANDLLAPYRALSALAESPEGRLPFSTFGQYLPGDNLGTLESALQLMKRGWVEFVGNISETSDVRLTPGGRDLVETLRKSIAAS